MAGKLRSITKQIHWSLASKALVLGAVWLLASSRLVFFVVALSIYFFPIFRPFEMIGPLLFTLILAVLLPQTIWTALFLGSVFFLVLGIKDLVFVKRDSAYQMLAALLWLAISSVFFLNIRTFEYPFASILIGLLFFILVRNFLLYVLHAYGEGRSHLRREVLVSGGIGALVISELAWAYMFLPLIPLHQTALLFFAGTIIMEFLIQNARGKLGRTMIIANTSVFVGFLVIILLITQWTL